MAQIGFLDGGTGQEIYKQAGKPDARLWSVEVLLKQPEIVTQVHAGFIAAGCRTLTLNTYTATPTRLAGAGIAELRNPIFTQAKQAMNEAIAQSGCDVERAGCLPPLHGSYLPDPPRSFDSMLPEFQQLCELQADLDLLLIETMSNSTEARAACAAATETGLPYALGLRVEPNGKLRSGESLEHAIEACLPYRPNGIWLNCSAPEDINVALPRIAHFNLPFGAYANGFISVEALAAGNSVALLGERSDITPQVYAELAQSWVNEGARLIGGCCEVTAEHMRATAERLIDSDNQLVKVSKTLKL